MKQVNIISKKSLTALVVVYTLLVFTGAPATGQNLVTNSGFSSGSTGWATSCSIEVNPETAYGGTNSSNYATEIDVERCFNQNICILPGLTYSFSFKATRRTQSGTAAAPGISFKVTGLTTATDYINITKTYNNTVFNLQAESYSFTIPANSTDTKVNIAFTNYNNTATYGVILDDIQLVPAAGSTLSINGADILSPGLTSSWSVNNATSAITGYNWNFGTNASQAVSALAAPSAIQWSALGNPTVSVALSNGTCTVTTLSKSIYIINQLLAVQLVSFTGAVKDNKNQLAWSTQNEENNSHFIIERSVNGIAFDSIGNVTAAGTGTANNYSFTDVTAEPGTDYYRLRQVDRTGAYKNSNIVIIKNNASVKEAVQLFPNPAISTIHVQLNSTVTTTASVEILNVAGKIMINKYQTLSAGNNKYSVDINNLETGMYFIKVADASGNIQFVQSFSKIK